MSTAAIRPSPGTLWRDEFRACVALSVPLVVTNAIEMAMNLTNTALIGHIAPDALAAVTLALALYNVVLTFGIGLTAAVSPLISREVGRNGGQGEAARRVVQGGFWNAVLIIGPIWALLWEAEPIFRAFGQDPALSHAAAIYLRVIQWSLFPVLVYLVLRSMLAALQRPRWAVVTGLAAVVLNAGLNVLLIGGGFGLPALGFVGSGMATVVSNVFMAAALGLAVTLDAGFERFGSPAGCSNCRGRLARPCGGLGCRSVSASCWRPERSRPPRRSSGITTRHRSRPTPSRSSSRR